MGDVRFINIIDYIFQKTKENVATNQNYNTKVLKTTPQELTKLPLIVVEEIDDKLIDNTLVYKQRKYRKTIEINIYTTDVPIGTMSIAKQIVADELKILVDEVLSDTYNMSRISCNETPNADRNIYRLTIRYRCIVDENYKIYGGRI